MTVHFRVAEMASGSYWHLAFLRWSMVAIFVWFGIQKFTPYAAEAIAPLIANSPFMGWLRVFGVRGEAKIIGTIELTTASPDFRIGDPDRICCGRGYGLRYVPLNCVVLFQHAWGHSEKLDRFPNHLDVVRTVSAEGHCPARCVLYAASGILVAVTCGRHFGNCSTGYNRSFRDSYAPTADRTSDRGGRQRVANVVLGQVASGLASPGRPKASPLYS